MEAAGELGVRYLTVFGFSTENWSRPADEVSALMELLRLYVARDLDRLAREGVRIRIVGDRSAVSEKVRAAWNEAEAVTANNTRTLEQKKAFFKRTADLLAENPGLRREDVLISLVEVGKENWSFGNGIAQYA